MKTAFFGLFAMAGLLFSCQMETDPGEQEQLPTVIAGKITNAKGEYVQLKRTWGLNQSEEDSTRLGDDGTFRFDINPAADNYYYFIHGREHTPVYITPGDSLFISLNADEFDESLKYSGSGANLNNYIASKVLLMEKLDLPGGELYAMECGQFADHADSVKQVLEDNLEEQLVTFEHLPVKFEQAEKAAILYSWAAKMVNYPRYHKHYTQQDSIALTGDYYNYLTEVNFNDPELIDHRVYQSFLNNYLREEANNKIMEDTALKSSDNYFSEVKFRLAREKFTNQAVLDLMLSTIMQEQIMYYGIKNLDRLVAEYESLCMNKEYIASTREDLDQWKHLASGKPAPGFSFPDINGDTVSLDDFKGKYVYLDVWATWCGPCKEELPHLNALKKEFGNSNIAFVCVSLDDSKADWETMVRDKQLSATQLFAQGFGSSIAKNYRINSIPRFILIDTDGNIMDVNAPRPSGKIREVLKTLGT